MDTFDKDLKRNINKIQKAVKELRRLGLKIEVEKDIETMVGVLIDHVYVVDRLGSLVNGRIILQKHLFSSEYREE